MSDVLRGGLNTLGVPGVTGDFKLQLKRPKAKNTKNVPELVAKFGELKRKMLELAQENESLKQQLIKTHETNSLLSQENALLKQKEAQIRDVEATIDESIEELLSATEEVETQNEKPQFVSKIPRPVRFTLARKEVKQAPKVADIPSATVTKREPTLRSEVRPKTSVVIPSPTPITKNENVPSPFEVVDLTLRKKDEAPVVSTPVQTSKEEVPETKEVVVEKAKETPAPFFPTPNILEENKIIVAKKEKAEAAKIKLEAVNDVVMEDVKTFLLGTTGLPLDVQRNRVVEFLNLDIMPKQVPVATVVESKPKDVVGDKLAKLAHLSEVERSRLYADLNMTLEEFFAKNLTTEGVLYI